jgi:hypothetical protein
MEEIAKNDSNKIDEPSLENKIKSLQISDSVLNELGFELDDEISDDLIDKYVEKLKGFKNFVYF